MNEYFAYCVVLCSSWRHYTVVLGNALHYSKCGRMASYVYVVGAGRRLNQDLMLVVRQRNAHRPTTRATAHTAPIAQQGLRACVESTTHSDFPRRRKSPQLSSICTPQMAAHMYCYSASTSPTPPTTKCNNLNACPTPRTPSPSASLKPNQSNPYNKHSRPPFAYASASAALLLPPPSPSAIVDPPHHRRKTMSQAPATSSHTFHLYSSFLPHCCNASSLFALDKSTPPNFTTASHFLHIQFSTEAKNNSPLQC